MTTAACPGMAIPQQVYPGLRPFRRDESILFFGRQEHVDELLGRLEDTSFLAVVGLSGSGKSSLVLAGLVPALERGHLGGASALWQIVEMRPGSDPLGALAAALDLSLEESPRRAERLRSGRLGLVDAASPGRTPGANLLLVVDQFEELFRFQRDFENRSHEAAEFVRLLLAATGEYEARLYVVITMRSDYLGECARFPRLAEALNGSQYLTPRLTREKLREAMTGPAALEGAKVEPRWLESVLDQVSESRDQLPVLQHLLRRMRNREGRCETIGEVGFEAVGGLRALNEHAESVYGAVGNKELARRVFQCLTESAEPGHENRRPLKMQELIDETGSSFGAVNDIVDHFREEGCSFLGPPPDKELTSDSVIDITHESLIRGWDRLREWARENADSGEWYRRIEDRLLTSRGKLHLTGPELEAAIEARRQGGWNPAWARRYAGKAPGNYGEVLRLLDDSHRRSVRRERAKRRILTAVAIGMGACALWAVVFNSSWWSDRRIASEALTMASEIPTVDSTSMSLPSLDALNRLETLRRDLELLSAHRRGDAPLLMRWGFHIGDDIYFRVRRTYFEKFRQILLLQTQKLLLDFLRSLPGQPGYAPTYDALKAYLITTSTPDRSTREFLAPVLLDRWSASRQVGPAALLLARRQFDFYADELRRERLFSIATDMTAVNNARRYLSEFADIDRVYAAMISEAGRNAQPISFNRKFPGSAETVIDSYEVPGAFTKPGWYLMRQALGRPESYFGGEKWVVGDDRFAGANPAQLRGQLEARYYSDFVRQWRGYLNSAFVNRYANIPDAARKLDVLSSNQSPLLALFSLASQNTAVGAAEVADYFQAVQTVVQPNAASLIAPGNEAYMSALLRLQSDVAAVGQTSDRLDDPTTASVLSSIQRATLAAKQLAQHFRVDPEGHIDALVEKLMQDPIVQAEALLRTAAPAELNAKGREFCGLMRGLLSKYPFDSRSNTEGTITEVDSVFQPSRGAVWSFYDEQLKKILLRQDSEYLSAPRANVAPAFVQFFNLLADISRGLYPSGASEPEIRYSLKAVPSEGLQGFSLEIDGQTLSYNGGAPPATQFIWRGSPRNEVRASIRLGDRADITWFNAQGVWAVFRFFDQAESWQPLASGRYRLQWTATMGNHPVMYDGRPLAIRFDLEMSPPIFRRGYLPTACVAQIARQ